MLALIPLLSDTTSDPDVRINVLKVLGKLNNVSDDLKTKRSLMFS